MVGDRAVGREEVRHDARRSGRRAHPANFRQLPSAEMSFAPATA